MRVNIMLEQKRSVVTHPNRYVSTSMLRMTMTDETHTKTPAGRYRFIALKSKRIPDERQVALHRLLIKRQFNMHSCPWQILFLLQYD